MTASYFAPSLCLVLSVVLCNSSIRIIMKVQLLFCLNYLPVYEYMFWVFSTDIYFCIHNKVINMATEWLSFLWGKVHDAEGAGLSGFLYLRVVDANPPWDSSSFHWFLPYKWLFNFKVIDLLPGLSSNFKKSNSIPMASAANN